MACYIFGAGTMTALRERPAAGDYVIAADGGWLACRKAGIVPDLLLGDFDSLAEVPDFPHVERVPVEKDDTDMMLAAKRGLALGHRQFHLYGGLGGSRTDHTMANFQTLVYLARRGAEGWLYGHNEAFTAIDARRITFPAREKGVLSVFCMGADACGVSIRGAQYEVESAVLTADFPLGVSNHFVGKEITVSVERGSLLLGLGEE